MLNKYEQLLKDTQDRVLSIIEINEVNQWVLESNNDGYVVYTKLNADNGLNTSRIQTEVQLDLEKLTRVAFDITLRKKYDNKIEDATLIEQIDDNTAIHYIQGKQPIFMVDARDYVIISHKVTLQDGSTLIISKSIDHMKYPPVKGITRANMTFQGIRLQQQPDNKVKVVVITNIDIMGDIPKALINTSSECEVEVIKSLIQFAKTLA